MLIKIVVVNLDSSILKVDVSEAKERLRKVLGVNGDLRKLVAEASTKSSNSRKVIDEILEELEIKTAEEAKIDQEDLEAICTLKAIGVKLALVTMRGKKSTEIVLERMNLKDVFDIVITRDDEAEKAKQIVKACNVLGHQVNDALYVGFSRADAIAGLQAGCLVATPHKVLQAMSRIVNVNSLNELLNVFKFSV
ncbi:MAG: HAD hydrolase-like protein [Candidatus Nezhaarchaeota archaeon]|nr:HAD hydrolase-like protein [Candidatus Nezhaarchaeota archaeon]MCX8141375.1 HAD hydrolase-like protein [Candidatus Nezhaarchaeota archaeon]MDW8049641.1 HAD hydrolase-like protein [Nitrososphaerota archaeon]